MVPEWRALRCWGGGDGEVVLVAVADREALRGVLRLVHADGDEQSHFGSPPPPSPKRHDGQPSFVATPPLPPLGGLRLNVGGGFPGAGFGLMVGLD